MSSTHKTLEDAREFVTRVAEHQGWALVPDKDFLEDLLEGLKTNYNRYGYFLCPCRDGTGDRKKDEDIVCPCVYNLLDQNEYGHCFCGLFMSKEFARKNKMPQPIPERRPEELQMQ